MVDQPDQKLEFTILTHGSQCRCGAELHAEDARVYKNGFLIICRECHQDTFGVKVKALSY